MYQLLDPEEMKEELKKLKESIRLVKEEEEAKKKRTYYFDIAGLDDATNVFRYHPILYPSSPFAAPPVNDDTELSDNPDGLVDQEWAKWKQQQCSHEWKETLGFAKTYKDCTKCQAKYEDVYK